MSFSSTALQNVKYLPFWLDAPDAPEAEPALSGATTADLLIVGGGFTGLWAAVQAKEDSPDRDIVLIEGRTIAWGASGRPGGIVSTSVMHGLSNAKRLFPDDLSELERLGHENLEGFRDTIKRHNIDCHDEWGGELTVSIGEDGKQTLDEEYPLALEYGHQIQKLDQTEVQQQIASPLFSAGLWSTEKSGTVHPARLAWGLKAAALKLGVRIYENTSLTKVKRTATRGDLEVTTDNGSIRTPKVFLATNAFASGHRRIRKRVAAIRDRIIATEPLTDEQMDRIGWKNRQGIYDTRTQLNYMRLTKDNRIIFGGRLGYYFGNNTDPEGDKCSRPYLGLAEAFNRTFPQLDDITFSHAWSGPIALTTRMAVHFQTYMRGDMIYAGGYSGFGVTTSRFGARVGLAALDGKEAPEMKMAFARTEPGYIPPEPFRWIGAKVTMYAIDTVDEKGGWRHPWVHFVEKLGFPVK